MRRLTILPSLLFIFLFILSIYFYISGFEINDFQFSKIHYQLYFLAWVSLGNIIFALILAYASYVVFKHTKLEAFRFIPLSLFFFVVGMIINCFHLSYCKICSDLGFCGTAHVYPNVISILSIGLSFVLYLINQVQVLELRFILRKLWIILSFGFGLIVFILFISLFYMNLPNPISYKIGSLNFQGLIFVFVSLFSFLSFSVYCFFYFKTRNRIFVAVSIQFIIIGISQLVSAYHIFTCYWCNIEECSEFFSLSGIMILTAVFILWYSYMPILYCKPLPQKTQTAGVYNHAKQCSDKDPQEFPDDLFSAKPFAVSFFRCLDLAHVLETCTI